MLSHRPKKGFFCNITLLLQTKANDFAISKISQTGNAQECKL